MDHVRRWGLVCGCIKCNEKRKDGTKRVKCIKNGRRLHEAWPWIQLRIAEFKQWSNEVTEVACENDTETWTMIKHMCKKSASELNVHFKHYGIVPWLLARGDTVEGALECCKQITARPLAEHDTVTRDFYAKVGQGLWARAQGGEVTPALQTAVDERKMTMCDESPGEGFHRDTTVEHGRAPGSTVVHLKQKTRIKGVIENCSGFFLKKNTASKVEKSSATTGRTTGGSYKLLRSTGSVTSRWGVKRFTSEFTTRMRKPTTIGPGS